MITTIQKQSLIKMVSIKITGLNELNGLLTGLSRNLRKEINKESGRFMRDVQKSAKLRAPSNTGDLRRSIKVREEKGGRWVLTVGSPYGVYQEEGFRPHWIHRSMIVGNEGQEGFVFVSKSKPFVAPALEHNLGRLSQRMGNAVDKAMGVKK